MSRNVIDVWEIMMHNIVLLECWYAGFVLLGATS